MDGSGGFFPFDIHDGSEDSHSLMTGHFLVILAPTGGLPSNALANGVVLASEGRPVITIDLKVEPYFFSSNTRLVHDLDFDGVPAF